MTLTKLNSISFKGDIIKTRLSGDYLSYEVSCLFNKDKLNFLKIELNFVNSGNFTLSSGLYAIIFLIRFKECE